MDDDTLENRKLLILDLDETLIFSSDNELKFAEEDFSVGHFSVYKRPFLKDFLNYCKANFRVAIWTSASKEYAEVVAENILEPSYPLEFLWSRDRCTRKFDEFDYSVEWIKNLKKVKKLGFELDKVIMIDNTPAKLQNNYGNLVRIKDFEGQLNDIELKVLMIYLERLKSEENIRNIEKRGWRRNLKLESD